MPKRPPYIENKTVHCPLQDGTTATCSIEAFDLVKNSTWAAGPDGYIRTHIRGKRVFLHRLIWLELRGEVPRGYVMDHINRDKKENRFENLRLVTHSQNVRNRSKSKHATSRYPGVAKYGKTADGATTWVANIRLAGVSHRLGVFTDEREAHEEYLRAAEEGGVLDFVARVNL